MTHKTFAAYCKERWEFSKDYANKLIRSAEVVENVGTVVPISPISERQARPLTTVPMEQVGEGCLVA